MEQLFVRINGQPILQRDLENCMQGFALELFRKPLDRLAVTEREEVQTLAQEKVVARELIFQAALAAGVVASEASVLEEIAGLINNFPDPESFYATLEKADIEPMAYHRMVRQDLTVNQMTERELRGLADPDAAAIGEAYRLYPEKMSRSPMVRACHLLLRCSAENRAEVQARMQELKLRATQEDFPELARAYSQCPSAERGGELGFFKPGSMVKAFEDAAFSQPVGVVGDIVETPFGLHLIKVLAKEESAPRTLEEASEDIRALLKEQAAARHLRAWVEGLRASAKIEYPA